MKNLARFNHYLLYPVIIGFLFLTYWQHQQIKELDNELQQNYYNNIFNVSSIFTAIGQHNNQSSDNFYKSTSELKVAILNAKKHILVHAHNLLDNEIVQTLLKAKENGLYVYVIYDNYVPKDHYQIMLLKENNVAISIAKKSKFVHEHRWEHNPLVFFIDESNVLANVIAIGHDRFLSYINQKIISRIQTKLLNLHPDLSAQTGTLALLSKYYQQTFHASKDLTKNILNHADSAKFHNLPKQVFLEYIKESLDLSQSFTIYTQEELKEDFIALLIEAQKNNKNIRIVYRKHFDKIKEQMAYLNNHDITTLLIHDNQWTENRIIGVFNHDEIFASIMMNNYEERLFIFDSKSIKPNWKIEDLFQLN